MKNVIAFPKNSGMHKSLSMMVDCWRGIALSEGKTESEAARYALDMLGETLLSFKD